MRIGRDGDGGKRKTYPTNDILMIRQVGFAVLAAVDLVAV